MSHNVEKMMFVGETPWHGLGTKLEQNPSIKEAILAAGLDWEVRNEPLYYKKETKGEADRFVPVKSGAVMRKTDDEIFGYVTPAYTPLQNKDAFEWFQPFVDSEAVQLETAGSLRSGRHVWIMARISRDPVTIVKKADDTVLQYLLLANGHDGTMAANAAFCPLRVVCSNTLAAALNDGETKVMKAFHTVRVKEAMLQVRDIVDLTTREFAATAEQYRELALHDIDTQAFKTYVKKTFFPREVKREDLVEAQKTAFANILDKVTGLFEAGRGNDRPGVRGTWWAAMNSVTEYLNYVRGKNADRRLDSLWFGDAGRTLRRSLKNALAGIQGGKVNDNDK